MTDKPIVNILTRTSGRPKYFERCYESVQSQTYENINHLISVDDDETEEYVKKLTKQYVRVIPQKEGIPRIDPVTHARHAAHYNLYLNELRAHVQSGWIMFLDDDDMFMSDNAISDIINRISNEDELVFWKVRFPKTIIPPHELFKKKIIALNNFSMIGFMYNKKYDNYASFDHFSGGDFFFIKQLAPKVPNKLWINEIYTGLQRRDRMGGFGRRDDLTHVKSNEKQKNGQQQ